MLGQAERGWTVKDFNCWPQGAGPDPSYSELLTCSIKVAPSPDGRKIAARVQAVRGAYLKAKRQSPRMPGI